MSVVTGISTKSRSDSNFDSAVSKLKKESKGKKDVQKFKLYNNKQNNLISVKHDNLTPVPFTIEMFLESYGMGKINLSNIECPIFLKRVSFLKAPESYYEIRRLNTVEKYINLKQWEDFSKFNKLLKNVMKMFNVSGASISLINSRFQIVKYQYGLGFEQCSRQISIDSHAILSKNFFLVLDASKDWRFKNNPIVKDLPSIKFYLGLPLLTKNKQIIGVLSIFDPFSRNNIDNSVIKIMEKVSSEIMEYLNYSIKHKDNVNSDDKILHNFSIENKGDDNDAKHKLLKMYGRATCNNKNNEEIIFEKDGSGTSYKYNSNFKFNRKCSSYDNLIDLNIWRELCKYKNLKLASEILCENLINKLNYDCIYIINVKSTEICLIENQYLTNFNKEIDIDKFKFEDKIKWIDNVNKIQTQMKMISSKSKDCKIRKMINNEFGREFHKNVAKSEHGLNYQSKDWEVLFHSGFSLPFYRYPNKIVKKRGIVKEENELTDIYFKTNVYLITCFNNYGDKVNDSDIGYVYGCASILRRMFFY